MALNEEGIIDVPGMLSRWVRLPSGAKAHYMTAGESGPNVVLLHGGIEGSSGTAGWRFMAPFLAENGFRVYCPDQPGFGLTEDPEHKYVYGAAGHVDFVHDFTTTLNLDKFYLAGNSMGCINTVNYVTAHPERVLGYALIAGSIGDLVDPALREEVDKRPVNERPRSDIFDGTKESMKNMMEAIIYRKEAISDDLLEMRTNAANKNRPYQKIRQEYNRNPGNELAARLSTKGRFDKMTIPGIYLFGVDDVLIPVAYGYFQEDALPNVQFFYPEECGHQGQTDQPEMFNQVFLEFFRDGKVSRKTADWAGVSKRRPELSQFVAQS
jgi:pimeloyl-ACP methyl ester carboxylesterase